MFTHWPRVLPCGHFPASGTEAWTEGGIVPRRDDDVVVLVLYCSGTAFFFLNVYREKRLMFALCVSSILLLRVSSLCACWVTYVNFLDVGGSAGTQ